MHLYALASQVWALERATFRYYIASVENKDEKQAIEIMHRVSQGGTEGESGVYLDFQVTE